MNSFSAMSLTSSQRAMERVRLTEANLQIQTELHAFSRRPDGVWNSRDKITDFYAAVQFYGGPDVATADMVLAAMNDPRLTLADVTSHLLVYRFNLNAIRIREIDMASRSQEGAPPVLAPPPVLPPPLTMVAPVRCGLLSTYSSSQTAAAITNFTYRDFFTQDLQSSNNVGGGNEEVPKEGDDQNISLDLTLGLGLP